MAGKGALASLAFVLLAGVAYGQFTGQIINKLVPEPLKVVTSPTVPGVREITPAFPARRRLIEDYLDSHPRALLQVNASQPTSGTPPVLTPTSQAFFNQFSGSTPAVGRKMLATVPQLVFFGEVVQQVVTQQAIANYVFDAQAIPFLSVATNPPAGLKFLSATLDFPGEQTATNVPTFAVSTTGFLPTASSPVIVRLENQTPTNFIPNIGLRFDYAQTGGSPFVSLYYTDFIGSYPAGLPAKGTTANPAAINLAQTFGLYIAPNGQLFPGQG